jgi:hypothetical protein
MMGFGWVYFPVGFVITARIMHLKFTRVVAIGFICLVTDQLAGAAPIDREALVSRHNVELKAFDARNPLSVGNGEFCFTVDATGLQTFPEAFVQTTPLATMADWAWHTAPNPEGYDIDKFQFKLYTNFFGRPVPYADVPHNVQTPEIKWLRANPHKLDLAQIGFVLRKADGSLASRWMWKRWRTRAGMESRFTSIRRCSQPINWRSRSSFRMARGM